MMPGNRALRARTRWYYGRGAAQEIGRDAFFEPSAIQLLAQIHYATGARFVVSSGWRYTVGLVETRAKLIQQGLDEDMLHEDWACPPMQHGEKTKFIDIENWLSNHPEQQPGSWLVIDNVPGTTPEPTLLVDGVEGLCVRDAAAAIRYFGRFSERLGMRSLDELDIPAEVHSAFNGRRVELCRWLEGVTVPIGYQTPSKLLRCGRPDLALRLLPSALSLSMPPGPDDDIKNALLGRQPL
ncbi:HAD domain-containing protein [Falsiroseomonas sp.]|uniref:HAD domain-containing protein n=1 Tax=Falsiroseomonas sp. TaxID=2870721 RepID=UPI003F72507F